MADSTLKYECPTCQVLSTFSLVYSYTHPKRDHSIEVNHEQMNFAHVDYLIFKCIRCHEPVAAHVGRHVSDPSGTSNLELEEGFEEENGNWILIKITPCVVRQDIAPEYTPVPIDNFFEQGCRALDRGDMDAAGVMFGKALDVSTRDLIRKLDLEDKEKAQKLWLAQRIDWLIKHGALKVDLSAAAKIIKDERNEAAHGEKLYAEAEAKKLRDLTKVFFTAAYTVPGMVAAKLESDPGNEA